jgi:hypothetical protein
MPELGIGSVEAERRFFGFACRNEAAESCGTLVLIIPATGGGLGVLA